MHSDSMPGSSGFLSGHDANDYDVSIVCVCVCVCVCACMRACVRACVRAHLLVRIGGR